MSWTLCGFKVFLVLALVFCTATLVFPQSATTSLRGTILDPNSLAVADATVSLAGAEIGANLNTRSDKNGFYQFQDLRPGTYVLTVTATGFATNIQSGLVLLVSTPASRDVKLEISSESTTVEVNAGTEVIN